LREKRHKLFFYLFFGGKKLFRLFLCLQEGRTIVRPEPELCDGDAESEEEGRRRRKSEARR
jgi:hypothetical protein